MNRIEAVAGISLAALFAAGVSQKYGELKKLSETPAPSKDVKPKLQAETRPERTIDSAVAAYLASAEMTAVSDKATRLAALLAALESPEFEDETLDSVTSEDLARVVVDALQTAPDGTPADLELRVRAVGFLSGRVPGRTSRDFVLQAMEEGPSEVRDAAVKHAGYPTGVRGKAVYEKVKELGEKGLVPDALLPGALRRLGGVKAKEHIVSLMKSTDSAKLITACALSLQDYRDPEMIGVVLERLEAVGMLDSAVKMPWVSPALLDEHLKTADKQQFRRGMMAMAARPALVKPAVAHAEKGLQSADADTRRFAAVAVKKATVAKVIDAKQGESLLAGRLQVETEPVLKAELTGGLERVRTMLEQKETGVQ